jgi:cytochrome c
MKATWIMGVAAAAALTAAAPANAALDFEAGKKLAGAKNCLACHAVDKKLVGPSYKEVAKKYAGDKAAEAKLIEKVKKGGKGVWGDTPMPPNSPAVKDDDIKALVQWILAIK